MDAKLQWTLLLAALVATSTVSRVLCCGCHPELFQFQEARRASWLMIWECVRHRRKAPMIGMQ